MDIWLADIWPVNVWPLTFGFFGFFFFFFWGGGLQLASDFLCVISILS